MTATQFVQTAIREYWVGALTKSSRFVVNRVSGELPQGSRTIVEYGPGDGVLTRGLLTQCAPDGRLLAIEKVAEFLGELRAVGDPRLQVLLGDVHHEAPQLRSRFPAGIDAVVSGIPFTFFSPETREEIARATAEALRPGGRFIVYQYSPLMRPVLSRYFSSVRMSYEPRNFPPYFIMTAIR